MKLYDCGTSIFIFIVVVGLMGFLSSRILGDDNPIEEFTEEIIEQETGIEIDLSPKSAQESHGCHP